MIFFNLIVTRVLGFGLVFMYIGQVEMWTCENYLTYVQILIVQDFFLFFILFNLR